MKPIEITQKFRPFSHQPGIHIPFPLLQLVFVVHPSKIEVMDWRAQPKELMTFKFKFKSPCKKMTAMVDLPKQKIEIHLLLEDNFAQMTLNYDDKKQHFTLSLDRYKEDDLNFEVSRPNKISVIRRKLTKKKPLILFKDLEAKMPKGVELLSLGCHKKQEIEKIFYRQDLREFLPLWYLWGQFCTVKPDYTHKEGHLVFLNFLQEKMEKKEHDQLSLYLNNIARSAFMPMMVPQLEDFKHWGFFLPRLSSSSTSPWLLLAELYQLVRQMFIFSKDHDYHVLPHLPEELHCGKLVKAKEHNLTFHLEWTKKTIRRMILFASKNETIHLHFQNKVKRFRLKLGRDDKGNIYENHAEFVLKKNKTYFFDCFEE